MQRTAVQFSRLNRQATLHLVGHNSAMSDGLYSSEAHDERLKAALAQLRLIAHQAEQALEELATRMRGTGDSQQARRSDEIAMATLARVGRRDTTPAP